MAKMTVSIKILRLLEALVFWLVVLSLIFSIRVALYSVFIFGILAIIAEHIAISEFDEDVPH